jgi:hypothetical protein
MTIIERTFAPTEPCRKETHQLGYAINQLLQYMPSWAAGGRGKKEREKKKERNKGH